MLGVIVVATNENEGGSSGALLEDFLGAPLLARAVAGALPKNSAAYVVLVVPPDLKDEIATSVVERFGLDEVEMVLGHEGNYASAVTAGLRAVPDDIDQILITDGTRILVPGDLVERTVVASQEHGAATPAVPLLGAIVADEEGAVPVDIRPRLRALQGPQVFRRDVLEGTLEGLEGNTDLAEAAAHAGANVQLVEGDRDNFCIVDAADRGRALEVFARRAVDFAFVYPSDLLPEDPLRVALTPTATVDSSDDVEDEAVTDGASNEDASNGEGSHA